MLAGGCHADTASNSAWATCVLAADSQSIHLRADLTGPAGSSGWAQYRWEVSDGVTQVELEIEVDDAAPLQAHTVVVDEIPVGQLRTDAEGMGKLKLSSQPEGDSLPLPAGFPVVVQGTPITVGNSIAGIFGGGNGNVDPPAENFLIHLKSALVGQAGARGEVEFQLEQEDFGQRVEFQLQAERLPRNTTFAVTLDGTVVASIMSDSSGIARLKLRTDPSGADELPVPPDFPPLGVNSLITVGDVLTGHFVHSGAEATDTDHGSEINLSADLHGDTLARGEVEFESETEEGNQQREFKLEVKNFPSDSTQDVTIDGVVVARLAVDGQGRAKLKFATDPQASDEAEFPAEFPVLTAGSIVSVGGLANGYLHSTGGDDGGHTDGDTVGEESTNNLMLLLEAVLRGATLTHGHAQFRVTEEDGQVERELEIEIEDAPPGSSHLVVIDGQPIDEVTVDDAGRGGLRFSSQAGGADLPFPGDFPQIVVDMVIAVGSLVEGRLLPAGTTPTDDPRLDPPDNHGQDEDVELRALLAGDGGRGFVEFESQRDGSHLRRKFDVEVSGLTPVTMYPVTINQVAVGSLTTDQQGEGKLELSTDPQDVRERPLPAGFPVVAAGDTVRVGSVLLGVLFQHDEAQADIDEDDAVDADDIDLMYDIAHADSPDLQFDLNHDGHVNVGDVEYLISRILGTALGDANLDGVFDTSDLVEIFQAGQYEDDRPVNSSWHSGDWNGDHDFDSGDLIVAFQHGAYEQTLAPRITSQPSRSASVASPYRYQLTTSGNPPARYELVAAPTGMALDALTGQLEWTPSADQVGDHVVTVGVTNAWGRVEQTFTLAVAADGIAPTAPGDLRVDAVTTDGVTLAWNPSTDNMGVDHYAAFRVRRCGFRGIKRCYSLVNDNIQATTTTISDLEPLSSHTFVVRAVDAAGNMSYNSNSVVVRTQGAPNIMAYAPGSVTIERDVAAQHELLIQLRSTGNPAPTYAIVDGPDTMALDAQTGIVTWTPTVADIGNTSATFRASNAIGSSEIVVPITIRPDVPVLSVQINPDASDRFAFANQPFAAQIQDASHTPPTFELVSAPLGMTIDAASGRIDWTPTLDDAGRQSVVVRASNDAGQTEIAFEFETYFIGEVSGIEATGLTDLHPTISWTAPTGPGADRIAGYTVVAVAHYRRGRARRTERVEFDVPGGDTTNFVLEGLTSGRKYKLLINAYDDQGGLGLTNTQTIEFVSVPAIPTVGWQATHANGSSAIVAGQPMHLQLTNLRPEAVSYQLLEAPAGFQFDAASGLGTWIPAATDVGDHVIRIRAINDIGPRDLAISVHVHFTGPVINATATESNGAALVRWDPPSDSAQPIESYRVTLHWRWSGRPRSRTITLPGSAVSATLALVPRGSVWFRGVSIVPISADGAYGVSSGLIPLA
jgi:hypothetical protein